MRHQHGTNSLWLPGVPTRPSLRNRQRWQQPQGPWSWVDNPRSLTPPQPLASLILKEALFRALRRLAMFTWQAEMAISGNLCKPCCGSVLAGMWCVQPVGSRLARQSHTETLVRTNPSSYCQNTAHVSMAGVTMESCWLVALDSSVKSAFVHAVGRQQGLGSLSVASGGEGRA